MDKKVEEGCTNSNADDEKCQIRSENPSNNQVEEEEEEALSLCDLPINEENHPSRKEPIIHPQEDFNFCSWGDSSSKESSDKMCVADEVFFQGQILPMRHSISFDTGRTTTRRCLSRSESMDHHSSSSYSVGFTSVSSSRSSSINSLHSSSSSGSSSAAAVPKIKPKIQNQFQFSQPSPKPQIRKSKEKISHVGINPNRNNPSTFWSFLRVGLVNTPEIAMQDLKLRSKSNNGTKNFGSRSSTSSINSSTFITNNGISSIKEADKKQRQHKFFDRNRALFTGCKCSSNAVVGPIPSRVPINAITRNRSAEEEEDNSAAAAAMKKNSRTTAATRKQSLSRLRTFEWLKQLSLEGDDVVVIDEAEQNQQ